MREAVRFVLRGSRWHGKDDLASLMQEHGDSFGKFEKAFEQRYGDEDFDWPWFDEWLRRFAVLGRYPESWREFCPFEDDDDPEGPINVHDALAAICKADLLSLAKKYGIQVRSADKVEAIRRALADKLPQAAADTLVGQFEAERESRYKRFLRRRKRILLYRSVHAVHYAMQRAGQLAEGGFRYYVLFCDNTNDCPIHKRFDGITLSANHPFLQHAMMPAYPDDSCYVIGANDLAVAKLLGGKLSKKLPEDWKQLLGLI